MQEAGWVSSQQGGVRGGFQKPCRSDGRGVGRQREHGMAGHQPEGWGQAVPQPAQVKMLVRGQGRWQGLRGPG